MAFDISRFAQTGQAPSTERSIGDITTEILREFYGLGTPGGTAVESGSPKILNLADFL